MIRGERMQLRRLAADDLPRRLEMINDAEVQRQTIGASTEETSTADLQRWFEMVSGDPFSEQWAILTQDRGYVGDVDLHSIGVLDSEAWLSPMVGDQAMAADRDFRRELFGLMARFAFDQKKVHKVCVDLPDTDEVGVWALESLGFTQVDEMEMDPITQVRTLSYEVSADQLRPF